MIKNTGVEYLNGIDITFYIVGVTEENIEVIGIKGNNMEKANFMTRKPRSGRKAFGMKEKEFNGIILLLLKL